MSDLEDIYREGHAELHDIWRAVTLSRDDLETEIEGMAPDHPHYAPMTEAIKHLNAGLED